MATLTTPSTRRLSEVARHLVYPEGIVSSGWPRIKRRLSDMAVEYDGWQQGAAQLILGRDSSDRYAATVGGVTMSIPRQVGKTFTIGSLLVAMCLEYPGLRVVWTSHHLRTTTNTFRAMQGMVRRKKIAPHLAYNGIRTANGEQEIKFANGSIIMFGARERGFGVGIDAIDVLVCDECQRLTSRALADMVPTTNQAQHRHGALVFFIGTPPRPTDDGEEFAARRRKALEGTMRNGIYIELSADEDADPDDPAQWAIANPSYPHRTPHESMLRMRENLTDPDDWLREAMGRWASGNVSTVLPRWNLCHLEVPEENLPPVAAIGIAVSLDGEWGSIGSAEWWPHGEVVNLSAVERRPGSAWLVSEAKRIQSEHNCAVALDEKCPDPTLRQALIDAGVNLTVLKLEDCITAVGELENRVKAGTATHQHTTDLDAAIANAKWRLVSDRNMFARKQSAGDISMLEAVTMALHAANQSVDPWEAWT